MPLRNSLYCLLGICLLIACRKNSDPELEIEQQMILEVNKLRAQGCNCGAEYMMPAKPLVLNPLLTKSAEAHAKDMYSKNYFEHISPNGTSPIQRAANAGYTGEFVGENIARGYATVPAVINAWINSESHCKALMDTLYTEMGAAEYQHYWVVEFGQSKTN